MGTADLGESLVVAYMRHVEQCSIVLYNSFFVGQARPTLFEVKPRGPSEQRLAYLCEVTTHIGAMATTTLQILTHCAGRGHRCERRRSAAR